MSDYQTLVWLRGIERLLIVFGGFGFAVCGMMLFKWGVGGPAKLIVEAKDLKAQLVNASPGLFSMLFGAVLLGLGISNKAGFTTVPALSDTGQPQSGPRQFETFYYAGPEVDETRDFLARFRGDESKPMEPEQISSFRREAGNLLTKLDAAKVNQNHPGKVNPK